MVCRIHEGCLDQLIASNNRQCSLCKTKITSINGKPLSQIKQDTTPANTDDPIHDNAQVFLIAAIALLGYHPTIYFVPRD